MWWIGFVFPIWKSEDIKWLWRWRGGAELIEWHLRWLFYPLDPRVQSRETTWLPSKRWRWRWKRAASVSFPSLEPPWHMSLPNLVSTVTRTVFIVNLYTWTLSLPLQDPFIILDTLLKHCVWLKGGSGESLSLVRSRCYLCPVFKQNLERGMSEQDPSVVNAC